MSWISELIEDWRLSSVQDDDVFTALVYDIDELDVDIAEGALIDAGQDVPNVDYWMM